MGIRKDEKIVKVLAAGSDIAVDTEVDSLTLGGSDLDAFVGINGGTSDAVGLELTGVEFGLALLNNQSLMWRSLEASAATADFIGIEAVTIAADTLSVRINQAATDNSLVDYASQGLEIVTGSSSTTTLSMAASLGELLEVSGNFDVDLLSFFQVSGSFALSKSTTSITLADTTTGDATLTKPQQRTLRANLFYNA